MVCYACIFCVALCVCLSVFLSASVSLSLSLWDCSQEEKWKHWTVTVCRNTPTWAVPSSCCTPATQPALCPRCLQLWTDGQLVWMCINFSWSLLLLLLRCLARSLWFTIWGEFLAYVTVFWSNLWGSHIPPGACWVCLCCRHSRIYDMNVRIFGVQAMECMCAQTRPWFVLSSERLFERVESEPMLTPREKSPLPEKFSPEEDQTHNTASSRTVSPIHYQQAIPDTSLAQDGMIIALEKAHLCALPSLSGNSPGLLLKQDHCTAWTQNFLAFWGWNVGHLTSS